MTDKKRRPMLTVLCDEADHFAYKALAKRRRMNLSDLVRDLLAKEKERLDALELTELKLQKLRPAAMEAKQLDLEEVAAAKKAAQT